VHFGWLRKYFDVLVAALLRLVLALRPVTYFPQHFLETKFMGILTKENGEFKIEVIKEFAEDIANALEEGDRLSADDAENLAQKAHEYFSGKREELSDLLDQVASLEQGSLAGYGLNTGHPGMNDIFFEMLDIAISKSHISQEIESASLVTK